MTFSLDPERELEALTEKVERLAVLCRKLRIENQQLKDQYLARTQSARKRVKQMLERMQSISQRI